MVRLVAHSLPKTPSSLYAASCFPHTADSGRNAPKAFLSRLTIGFVRVYFRLFSVLFRSDAGHICDRALW
jgi:hypothetical protein